MLKTVFSGCLQLLKLKNLGVYISFKLSLKVTTCLLYTFSYPDGKQPVSKYSKKTHSKVALVSSYCNYCFRMYCVWRRHRLMLSHRDFTELGVDLKWQIHAPHKSNSAKKSFFFIKKKEAGNKMQVAKRNKAVGRKKYHWYHSRRPTPIAAEELHRVAAGNAMQHFRSYWWGGALIAWTSLCMLWPVMFTVPMTTCTGRVLLSFKAISLSPYLHLSPTAVNPSTATDNSTGQNTRWVVSSVAVQGLTFWTNKEPLLN